MPGGGGTAIHLRALADVMDGHNISTVQAYGLEERAIPDRTVEAIARRNIDAIRTVQPHGPYRLGGFSFGGLVAFEMACRLRADGEAVDILVMLDTHAPLRTTTLSDRARARTEVLKSGAPTARVSRAAVVATRWVKFGTGWAYEHGRRAAYVASLALTKRRGNEQFWAFAHLHSAVARRYLPSTTFDGPVFVVRARDFGGDLGWSKLTTGEVTTVEVPAPHVSLLRSPAVEKVSRLVSDALQ
jgi:thioesterase domain-containing protein